MRGAGASLRRGRAETVVVLALAAGLVATACGDSATEPVVDVSTTLPSAAEPAPPTSVGPDPAVTAPEPTIGPYPTAPGAGECGSATPADLDGDGLEDRVGSSAICTGTGEVFLLDEATFGVVAAVVADDLDADGTDEVLLFDGIEPPTVGRVFEFDASSPSGLVPVTFDGSPLAPFFSYYSGDVQPDGEAWFGCADLDGSGVEGLVAGSFTFDAAAGETRWELRPFGWGPDLVATEGPIATGSYPADEWSVSDLMPGRRFCKDQGFSVGIADGCSADELVAPPTPDELGPEAAATFRAIVDAAAACDFHELERIAGDDITLSFGGHTDVGAYLAAGEYAWDQEPLRILVRLMAMEPGYQDEFATWVWPTFWEDDEPATDDERAAIEAIFGRPFDDILVDGLSYIDYRIGIDTDGNWLYFVAGD